jgi:hypothetical protein
MSHCKITTQVELLTDEGKKIEFDWKNTLTSVNEMRWQEFDLAANGTISIWDIDDASETIGDFDRLILSANGDVDVELVIDDDADVGEELNSFRIVKGIPFILGADDAYANHSAGNIYGGTLDVIEQIRIDEPDSSAKKVTLILVT